MQRSVVVLQGIDSIPDLASLLAAQQWESRRATHPDEVVKSSREPCCRVGIAVFDAALPCSAAEFTRIAADSGMEWIAVVPRDFTPDRANARALASCFFDYHTLPVDSSRLLYSIGHAHGRALLRDRLAVAAARPSGRFGMIGESPRMIRMFSELEKVSRARAPLLITGESGVGKELAARAVHLGSHFATGPFVPVNCGALPNELIESLLFGHEKGAFTGAHGRQIGSIEAAHRGTIFLDEIGDLPRAAQASLLRFLQESTIVRVGSTRELHIDTRVIAATHVDLREAVRAGRFREDLFYRLNVLSLEIPALRDRDGDAALLAEHVLHHDRAGLSPGAHGFSRDALAAIGRYSWPGNVRELVNRVQRAMVMCDGPLITAEDMRLDAAVETVPHSLSGARDGVERSVVEAALRGAHYNVAATARALGISRVTLYRMLKRLQIPTHGNAKALDPRKAPI